MFGFGKQKTNGVVNIDKKRSINLDQAPVISMRQDLENILKGTPNTQPAQTNEVSTANTNIAQASSQTTPQSAPPISQPRQNNPIDLSEKYKSSPFLGPDAKIDQTNSSSNQPDASKEKETKQVTPQPQNIFPQNQNPQVISPQAASEKNSKIENRPAQAPFQSNQLETVQKSPIQNTSLQEPASALPPSAQPPLVSNNTPINSAQTNQGQPVFPAQTNFQSPNFQSASQQQRQPMVKPSFKINAPSQSHPQAQAPDPTIIPETNSANKTAVDTTRDPKKEPAWGKLLFLAILIFVVLVFTAAGYYIWLTKKSKEQSSNPVENTQSSQIATQNTSFLADQPNPVTIDIDNMDKYQIKNILKKNADDVVKSSAKEAVEFNLLNIKNEPIRFEVFSDKVEMKLPASILYNLNSDFRIFSYNDNQKPFLGLSAASKDNEKLSEILVGEEMNLASSLEFFYFTSGYNPDGQTFVADSYGGAEIRSLEVNSDEGISLNYSVYKNRLLVGTSKMTLRSMIDYFNRDEKVQGIEDIVN
jgi:hypothetical protein